jgi:hypothetical protein
LLSLGETNAPDRLKKQARGILARQECLTFFIFFYHGLKGPSIMKNNKNKQCIIYIFQNLTTARWLEK